MDKIKRYSTITQVLLVGFALLETGIIIYKYFFSRIVDAATGFPIGTLFIKTIPVKQLHVWIATDAAHVTLSLAIYLSLFLVMQNYRKGLVFDNTTAKYYQRTSCLYFIFALAMPVVYTLSTLYITWDHGVGERLFLFNPNERDLYRVLTGFVLLILAYVTRQGRDMMQTAPKAPAAKTSSTSTAPAKTATAASAAKKTAPKKAPTKKAAPAVKAKAPTKKPAVAKKASPKKPATKPAVKKAPAKAAPAKKPAAKKSTPKTTPKAAPKKAPAKKTAPKKTTAKKAPAKK